jgi:hypothetical protein
VEDKARWLEDIDHLLLRAMRMWRRGLRPEFGRMQQRYALVSEDFSSSSYSTTSPGVLPATSTVCDNTLQLSFGLK